MKLAVFLLPSLMLAGVGCSSDDSVDLEHQNVKHFPPNFHEAIHDLSSRREELRKGPKEFDRKLGEFRDIVGWLPLLAGNGDLRRREWEDVQAISRELDERWGSITNASMIDQAFNRHTVELLRKLDRYAHSAKFDDMPGADGHGHSHPHPHPH